MNYRLNFRTKYVSFIIFFQTLCLSFTTNTGTKELLGLIETFKSNQSLIELKDNQKFSLKLPFNDEKDFLEVVIPLINLKASDYLFSQNLLNEDQSYIFNEKITPEAFLIIAGYCAANAGSERKKIEAELTNSTHISMVYHLADELRIKPLLTYLDNYFLEIFTTTSPKSFDLSEEKLLIWLKERIPVNSYQFIAKKYNFKLFNKNTKLTEIQNYFIKCYLNIGENSNWLQNPQILLLSHHLRPYLILWLQRTTEEDIQKTIDGIFSKDCHHMALDMLTTSDQTPDRPMDADARVDFWVTLFSMMKDPNINISGNTFMSYFVHRLIKNPHPDYLRCLRFLREVEQEVPLLNWNQKLDNEKTVFKALKDLTTEEIIRLKKIRPDENIQEFFPVFFLDTWLKNYDDDRYENFEEVERKGKDKSIEDHESDVDPLIQKLKNKKKRSQFRTISSNAKKEKDSKGYLDYLTSLFSSDGSKSKN